MALKLGMGQQIGFSHAMEHYPGLKGMDCLYVQKHVKSQKYHAKCNKPHRGLYHG